MKFKAIATDLDGTLLCKKAFVSKKNILALNEFIEKGGIVCFVTGRSFKSASKFALKFEEKTNKKIHYISGLKGAVIFDNYKNEFIYQNSINSNLANKIIEIEIKHKCSFGAYLKEDIFLKRTIIYNLNSAVRLLRLFKSFKSYEIINEWNPTNEVFKMNLSGVNLKVPFWKWKSNLVKCYQELNDVLKDQLEISKTAPNMYEITNKNCNKGVIVEKISEITNINLEEFVAFGDSDNDIDMFEKVGLGIMIGHKKSNLKKYANYQIPWFKKNAVAKGINKYIFNKK